MKLHSARRDAKHGTICIHSSITRQVSLFLRQLVNVLREGGRGSCCFTQTASRKLLALSTNF